MKKTFLILFLMAAMTASFSQAPGSSVIVYYFHGAYRCPTCLSIESHAKETINANFASQLKTGELKFVVVDVSKEENKQLAEKYEASGSALWVTQIAKGKETKTDLTDFAFSTIKTNVPKFEEGLKNQVEKDLK